MSKQKPVWRMNSGQGVPSDLGDSFVFVSGGLREVSDRNRHLLKTLNLFAICKCNIDIAAFQTTHTKAAKYESVVCNICHGKGVVIFHKLDAVSMQLAATKSKASIALPNWRDYQFESVEKCPHCNGKGYKMEKIK